MLRFLPADARPLGPETWVFGDRVEKRMVSVRKRKRALAFHRAVLPRMRALGFRCPRLLDASEDTLLLELLPGAVSHSVQAHRAAGRWLAALHSLDDVPVDPMPLADAVQRRLQAAAAGLPEGVGEQVLDAARPEDLVGLQRCWCHRDFHPRNWLWDGEAVAVLDFEHSGADAAGLDLCRVPQQAALLEGYGPLDPQARQAQHTLALLDAAGAWAWGLRHGDSHFEQLGKERLHRLISVN